MSNDLIERDAVLAKIETEIQRVSGLANEAKAAGDEQTYESFATVSNTLRMLCGDVVALPAAAIGSETIARERMAVRMDIAAWIRKKKVQLSSPMQMFIGGLLSVAVKHPERPLSVDMDGIADQIERGEYEPRP